MPSVAHAAHTRRKGKTTDSWITPKPLLDRLGSFDLDPCVSRPQPWATAAHMIDERENGLICLWYGFVWLNPPYGRESMIWMERMALHYNGIALLFARTDTKLFHEHVWPVASSLLFLRGRINFCRPDGQPAPKSHNSGGPSVLIGHGEEARRRLTTCADLGALVLPSRSQLPVT